MRKWVAFAILGCLCCSLAYAGPAEKDTQAQLEALKARVAELESQLKSPTYEKRQAELYKQMVEQLDKPSFNQSAGSAMTAGYDKGFFIKSADDQFLLGIGGLFQARYTYAQADDGDDVLTKEGQTPAVGATGVDSDASALELERARFNFHGHVLKDLRYFLQFEFGSDNPQDTSLERYWIAYDYMPELGVKLGQYKIPYGRQFTLNPGRLMLVDRSLVDAVFNVGYGRMVEIYGAVPCGDTQMHYQVALANGFKDTGDPFATNDNNPAITGRVVLPLLGATPDDFANESDLKGHENPVAQVGASFAYANATNENNFAGGRDNNYVVLVKGGDGLSNNVAAGGEVIMFGLDAALKSNGLSVLMEGHYQMANLDKEDVLFANEFGTARDALGIDGYEVDNYGLNAQAGYFIVPGTFELVCRAGGVWLDNTNDCYEYAGGWNWYFSGQDLKLSMDLSYIDDLPVTNSASNFDGVQNNSLLLLRTQLQFQF